MEHPAVYPQQAEHGELLLGPAAGGALGQLQVVPHRHPAAGGGQTRRPGDAQTIIIAFCYWLTVELQTNVRKDFTITEKDPARAFTWLKVSTRAFTFKTPLNHYAKLNRR